MQPSWVKGKRGEIDLDVLVALTLTRTGAKVDVGEARMVIGHAVADLLECCKVPRRRNGTAAIEYVARAAVRELAEARALQLQLVGLLATDAQLAAGDALALGDDLDELDEPELDP